MRTDVFYWILNMSAAGSVAIAAVLLLRKIKLIPKRYVYCLWIIPLLRLVIPISPSSRFSIMNLLKHRIFNYIYYDGKPLRIDFSFANYVQTASSYRPIVYKTLAIERIFKYSFLIWITVAAAIIIVAIFLYFFTKSEIKSSVHFKDNIYISDRISSSALYGVFHPKIIIPEGLKEPELSYIIMHERAHAARRDNLWRCIVIVICCVHWFNPLCPIALRCFFEDMELSCDSRVLRNLDKSKHKEYAKVVLDTAAQKSLFASSFGGAKVRVRIENILSYKKMTACSAIVLLAMITAICAVLLTNPI